MRVDRNLERELNVLKKVTSDGIIEAMKRNAAWLAVLVVGCARQPSQPPQAPETSGAAEVAAADESEGDEWTEEDEISGREMLPPVIVAEGERHTEETVVEETVVEETVPGKPGPSTEVIDLTADPVSQPVDTVHAPGERSPSGSLLSPDVLAGPK